MAREHLALAGNSPAAANFTKEGSQYSPRNQRKYGEKSNRRARAWKVVRETAQELGGMAVDLKDAAIERGKAYRDGVELPEHALTAAVIRKFQSKFPTINTGLGPINTRLLNEKEVAKLVHAYLRNRNERAHRRAQTAPRTSEPARR